MTHVTAAEIFDGAVEIAGAEKSAIDEAEAERDVRSPPPSTRNKDTLEIVRSRIGPVASEFSIWADGQRKMSSVAFLRDMERSSLASSFTTKSGMSLAALDSSLLRTLMTLLMRKRTRPEWTLMDTRYELTTRSPRELTVRLLAATWDRNMADVMAAAVEVAIEVVAAEVALDAVEVDLAPANDTVAVHHPRTDGDLHLLTRHDDHDLDKRPLYKPCKESLSTNCNLRHFSK